MGLKPKSLAPQHVLVSLECTAWDSVRHNALWVLAQHLAHNELLIRQNEGCLPQNRLMQNTIHIPSTSLKVWERIGKVMKGKGNHVVEDPFFGSTSASQLSLGSSPASLSKQLGGFGPITSLWT